MHIAVPVPISLPRSIVINAHERLLELQTVNIQYRSGSSERFEFRSQVGRSSNLVLPYPATVFVPSYPYIYIYYNRALHKKDTLVCSLYCFVSLQITTSGSHPGVSLSSRKRVPSGMIRKIPWVGGLCNRFERHTNETLLHAGATLPLQQHHSGANLPISNIRTPAFRLYYGLLTLLFWLIGSHKQTHVFDLPFHDGLR